MPSTTTAGANICCKCGIDVAGKKRMKDHQGQYWCADCGKADAKRKKLVEGGICAGCGEHFFGPGLTLIGDNTYCKKCLKTRAKEETAGFVNNFKEMIGGSRDPEKRSLRLLLIISAVIIAAAVWHLAF